MLLATLAQVDHAVSPFAPGPEAADEGGHDNPEEFPGSSSISADQASNGKDKPNVKTTTINQHHPTGEDIGVAISRDEFMAATRVESKKQQVTKTTSTEMDMEMDIDIDTLKQTTKFTKKVAKLDREEHEDTREITITKKKKRTREEEGQEQSIAVDVEKKKKVSSVTKLTTRTTSSSSTTTTIKEKKKYPRKKDKAGDEFDDIFGGLL